VAQKLGVLVGDAADPHAPSGRHLVVGPGTACQREGDLAAVEVAIRIALGASALSIITGVFRRAFTQIGLGVAAGGRFRAW
jgi:hypothetical protein